MSIRLNVVVYQDDEGPDSEIIIKALKGKKYRKSVKFLEKEIELRSRLEEPNFSSSTMSKNSIRKIRNWKSQLLLNLN